MTVCSTMISKNRPIKASWYRLSFLGMKIRMLCECLFPKISDLEVKAKSKKWHFEIPKIGHWFFILFLTMLTKDWKIGFCPKELIWYIKNLCRNQSGTEMSLETRSTSALFKRAEQLKRWQESDTFLEPCEPKHKSRRIQVWAVSRSFSICTPPRTSQIMVPCTQGAWTLVHNYLTRLGCRCDIGHQRKKEYA